MRTDEIRLDARSGIATTDRGRTAARTCATSYAPAKTANLPQGSDALYPQ
jgi:hypothetical protein